MAIYVYRPPACPACDTKSLIERKEVLAGQIPVVRYICPRCGFEVEGRDPAYMHTQNASMPLLVKSKDINPGVYNELDEPMRRHSNPPLTHEMLASRTVSDHLSPYPDHLTAHLPAELEERYKDNIAFAKESNVLGLFIDERPAP